MSGWEIFWAVVIGFSMLSFTYMSVKMLYFGLPELKEMFTSLSEEQLKKESEK